MESAKDDRRRDERISVALNTRERERIRQAARARGEWEAVFARNSIMASVEAVEKALARERGKRGSK